MNPPISPFRDSAILCAVDGVASFWNRVQVAPVCLLAMDFDGTLLRPHDNPEEAALLPGIRETLRRVARQSETRLAILSERPTSDVLRISGCGAADIVGAYGFEHRSPDGRLRCHSLQAVQVQGLDQALKAAEQLVMDVSLDVRPTSLTLPLSGLPYDKAQRVSSTVERAWGALAPPHQLIVQKSAASLVIRAPGVSKADVLARLADRCPPDSLVVYVGTGAAAESAFQYLGEKGIGIRLGGPIPGTAAHGFLAEVLLIPNFLRSWLSMRGR